MRKEEPLKLEDLCVWKLARHTNKETGTTTETFQTCKNCTGYEKRDCYAPHKMLDEYYITTYKETGGKI